jgi:uncharacterized cupredoxin-like copper-binding protein
MLMANRLILQQRAVEPGKTAELTWTFSKATRLEFACNIPGHYQAGMKGDLTVSQ